MKRNHKKSKGRQLVVPVWTYEQTQKGLPYLSSVIKSLRESRLQAQQLGLTAERMTKQPGRPDRDAIIAQEETSREARLAQDRFQENLQELNELGIYCLDPICGLALIPFVHEDQLAWFVYDQFDPQPIRHWRFHNDPLSSRRPIDEVVGHETVKV